MNFETGESIQNSPSFKTSAIPIENNIHNKTKLPKARVIDNDLISHPSINADHSTAFHIENTISISGIERQIPSGLNDNAENTFSLHINRNQVPLTQESEILSQNQVNAVFPHNEETNSNIRPERSNNAVLAFQNVDNNNQTISQQNLNNTELISETEVKLYLIRTVGFFVGCCLSSIAILCMIHHDTSYKWVFLSFYGYLAYFIIESVLRAFYPQREDWRVREDLLNTFKASSAIFFLGCLHLRYLDLLPTSLFSFIPFLLTTINYFFVSRAPIAAKKRRFLNNCFFTFQSILISLKFEGVMNFGWKITFVPFWIYFIAIMCHYLSIISKFLAGVATVPPLHQSTQNEMDVLTQFLGLCWSFIYYGLNFVAFLGAAGFARAYNWSGQSFCLLNTAAFTGLFFSSLLIFYTVAAFKHLARYLRLSHIPRNVSIELQVPQRPQPQRIEMQVEERENYFIMRSWTYFLPLKNNLLKNAERLKQIKNMIKGLRLGKGFNRVCKRKHYGKHIDLTMLREFKDIQDKKFNMIREKFPIENRNLSKMRLTEQLSVTHIENTKENEKSEEDLSFELNRLKRNRYFSLTDIDDIKNLSTEINPKIVNEEEKYCYLCCEKPPNAVLLNCGHGGICYDCAVNLMKAKNKCMECRGVVDGIYKVDPHPKLFDIIKGNELTKIIKY